MSYFNMDSFGEYLPTNWEEIRDHLNDIAKEELEDREAAYGDLYAWEEQEILDDIWESFCNGELERCPLPCFDEVEILV